MMQHKSSYVITIGLSGGHTSNRHFRHDNGAKTYGRDITSGRFGRGASARYFCVDRKSATELYNIVLGRKYGH